MKANKVMVKIEVEMLSIDTLKGLLAEVVSQVQKECETGTLQMADGDSMKWDTKREEVIF